MQNEYLTTREAASYTKLSESYLAKLRMGTHPISGPAFITIGLRAIRYKRSDLDQWMSSRSTFSCPIKTGEK